MMLFESQFSDALDRPYAGTPANTVLIASTPCCGGHLLGRAMAQTGRLGEPFDYASPAHSAEWARRLETTTPETTLAELMARRTTANGVFGIEAHYEHGIAFGTAEKLLAQLPGLKVVHLRRADILRQAVSYAVAKQTGIWISGETGTGDSATYDPGLIDHCLNDIAVQNALWTSLFKQIGVEPFELTYETLAKDLPTAIHDVADYCGVLVPDEAIKITNLPDLNPENRQSESWISRYADDRLARRAILRRIGGLARRAWPDPTAP